MFGAIPEGRYLEVEATLQMLAGEISPVLSDVAVYPAKDYSRMVEAGDDIKIKEGGSVNFSGSYNDPMTGNHTISWDFGDGETSQGSLTPTHVYQDNGIYKVVLTVTGDNGFRGSDYLIVAVRNEVPVVDVGADAEISQGNSVSLPPATYTDAGVLDTHQAMINWGDGSSSEGLVSGGNGSGIVNGSHVYTAAGIYPIVVSVIDKDGAVGTAVKYVTVNNIAPEVSLADYEINEGDTVQFTGNFSDPGGQSHTISWDFGDGSQSEGSLHPSHTYLDNGAYQVILTVTDEFGASGTATGMVVVHNLPPVVEAGPDQIIKECESVKLPPSTFTDKGILDTHTATIDWGDGTIEAGVVNEAHGQGDVFGSHYYETYGQYPVTVKVIDKDGGEHHDQLNVVVEQVANIYELYPIALHEDTLAGAAVGTVLTDIYNGENAGNFGWLSWAGSPDANTAQTSLTIPGDSDTYVNPLDNSDHIISVGDFIQGTPGVKNSSGIRAALNNLIGYPIAVPVWDEVTNGGSNTLYRVKGFAVVILTYFQLPQLNKISAKYLGFITDFTEWKNPVFSEKYIITNGSNLTVQAQFPMSDATGNYMLVLKNGKSGSNHVDSAEVSLNGTVQITSTEVTNSTEMIKKIVTLNENNTLDIALTGGQDSFVVILLKKACENSFPQITSSPVTQIQAGNNYTYDVEAVDHDGDPLSYQLLANPTGMTIDTSSGLIHWSTAWDEAGVYKVLVEVRDDRGGASTQSFDLHVTEIANTAPQIVSEPVLNGTEGTAYAYDVEAIDSEGHELSYKLVQNPTGMTINNETGLINWQPSASQSGTYSIGIEVCDIYQAKANQSYELVIAEAQNNNPQIISQPSITAREGEPYVYMVKAVDADNDPLIYNLIEFPSGMTIAETTGLIIWTPDSEQSGDHMVTMEVTDGRGGQAVQSYSIQVSEYVNTYPMITSVPVFEASEGTLYNYRVEADDVDHDPLIYRLLEYPAGMVIAESTGLISWIPGSMASGSYIVNVIAEDGRGGWDKQVYVLMVMEGLNNPPQIISTPVYNGKEGQLYHYDVNATDPDGDVLQYELTSTIDGMEINGISGLITWVPSDVQAGTHQVSVRVIDNRGGEDTQEFHIDVAEGLNNDPVITSTAVVTAKEGEQYTYNVEAEDADNDVLKYGLSMYPVGMNIDENSGLIGWIPSGTQGGKVPVAVVVNDQKGGTTTQSFIIHVSEYLNNDPSIYTEPVITGNEGVEYQYRVEAEDLDNDGLTYELTFAPQGMMIENNEDKGYIRWTPGSTAAGKHPVTVQVTDGRGGYDAQSFIITIADTLNTAPVIVSLPITEGKENVLYYYMVQATDGDNDPLTYSLKQAPAGMIIRSDTGIVEWMPVKADVGDHAIVIEVNDGRQGNAQQSYTLTIAEFINKEPQITSNPILTGKEGDAYAYDVDATDGDEDILTYKLTVNPQGMTIDENTGLIRWTPTGTQAGIHDVTVKVTDPWGGKAIQSYQIDVIEFINTKPSFTSEPETNATYNYSYAYDAEAIDLDNDPLTFTLEQAPSGMEIEESTGLIGWTPTLAQVGNQPVTIKVADGRGGEAIQTFTIVCNEFPNRAPVINSNPLENAVEGSNYVYGVNATDADNDVLTYTLLLFPAGMSMNAATGEITWLPQSYQIGSHEVKLEVSDGKGGMVRQSYLLTAIPASAEGDYEKPIVQLAVTPSATYVNAVVRLTVTATDNSGIKDIILTVNGQEQDLDSNHQAYYTSPEAGVFEAIAVATDYAGNQGSASKPVRFYVGGSGAPPLVEITSPVENGKLKTPTDMIGTVNDTDLIYYTLEYSAFDQENYIRFAEGITPIVGDVLGKLDTTVMKNGIYTIRLIAEDATGLRSMAYRTVQVEGKMKLGNFSIAFKDLEIPMAGIPITVIRTYDSRERSESGDFGFGWNLSFADEIKLEESCIMGEHWEESYYDPPGFTPPVFELFPQKPHYVSITYPDGRVERFNMKVSPSKDMFKIRFVNASFAPEAGTFSTLKPLAGTYLYTMDYIGPLDLVYEMDWETFNPERYQLTTQEGYIYVINKNTGLESIQDPNGNKITITRDGIIHSGGQSVLFTRDSKDRITEVTDIEGNKIYYHYDYYGDLVSVTDRENNTTQFQYNDEHYLTDIIDPRGIKVARNEYDDSGKLIAHIDAEGNRIEYTHNIDGREEIITDRLGNPTRYIYDDDGNVLSQTNALGYTTSYTYDARGNKLSETNALGYTTSYTYDSKDNMLTQTDPLANTISYTYNSKGQMLTMTDAQGRVTGNEYDSKGNLTKSIDVNGHETIYTYDGAGNMISSTDPLGNSSSNTYNSQGNITSTTNALGQITSFTYDSLGNQTSQTVSRTTPKARKPLPRKMSMM